MCAQIADCMYISIQGYFQSWKEHVVVDLAAVAK